VKWRLAQTSNTVVVVVVVIMCTAWGPLLHPWITSTEWTDSVIAAYSLTYLNRKRKLFRCRWLFTTN